MGKKKKADSTPPPWRDRVKEFRRVRASELKAHAQNWRTHPEGQRKAMSAVLREVGFAGAVIARETENGGLEVIDGHLRTEMDPSAETLHQIMV